MVAAWVAGLTIQNLNFNPTKGFVWDQKSEFHFTMALNMLSNAINEFATTNLECTLDFVPVANSP
jgi:hypothetical protein